jgi:hypothetical protein
MTLDEMLADPMVRLVMRRDGVAEGEVRAMMQRLARRDDAARRAPPNAQTPIAC